MKRVLVLLCIAAVLIGCNYAIEPTEEVDPNIMGNWDLAGSYSHLQVYRLRLEGTTCYVLDGYSEQAGISCIPNN